jgi:putative metallohydrolase (TIGR04338 family)
MPRTTEFPAEAQRFYNAEDPFKSHEGEMSLEECRRYIRDVLSSDFVFTTFTFDEEILVGDGRGRLAARAYFDDSDRRIIQLPRWARTKYTILHEVAHHLVDHQCDHFAHGPEFVRAVLGLVRSEFGYSRYLLLRVRCLLFRVRVTKRKD